MTFVLFFGMVIVIYYSFYCMLGKIFQKATLSSQVYNKLKRVQKHNIIAMVGVLVLLLAIGVFFNSNNANVKTKSNTTKARVVKTSLVSDLVKKNSIEVTGIVKSATQVDVIALAKGTVEQADFDIGDVVSTNQVLVRLYDSVALTNLNNAMTNFSNIQLSANTTKRLAEESVRQAELGLQNASQSLTSAEIALKAAEDNLQNTKELQSREVKDLKDSILIAVGGYLNTINNTLDRINFILKVEGNSQLSGIEATLGATDASSVTTAENLYKVARDEYKSVQDLELNEDTVEFVLTKTVQSIDKTKQAVDALIVVLDNTVASAEFSDEALLAQKNSFTAIRTGIVNASTAANSQLQAIQNQPVVHKQQLDVLVSAVDSARSQRDLALLSLENAQVILDQARQSSKQQIISAQTALDNSQGQLSLVQSQVSNLSVSAPISGQVIDKYVELGAEVRVGQKIATIAQSDLVKVKISLTSDDVYNISIGQTVVINNEFQGVITRIDPVADAVSRKVGVEIVFDNTDNVLIPETFVDVSIPLNVVENTGIFVPIKAVSITQMDRFVYIIDDNNIVKRVKVEIGQIVGDSIEITNGLQLSDRIVVDGAKQIVDGEKVNVE